MSTVVANPGNIVVPLSTIIDQLRGKLTSVEIEALLTAIVSKKKTEVHPGDLITADLMNQILLDLQDLNVQVAALAGGAGSGIRNSQAVTTLHEAWSFYGALVKSGEFLPTGTSADALKSAAEITAYLQDVMYTALAGGALGYSSDTTSLLDAFRRLYLKQHDVVVLFSASIAGIPDTSSHRQFATLLSIILEQDNALGEISLRKALDASDLGSAIAAQNRINGMVRDQGGDVTTGNIEVTYRGAVGNTETLVLRSTQPVLYRFAVTNRTNRNLDVQLSAEFLPPPRRPPWTQLSVVDTNGAAISRVPLAPRATQEVRVAAMTPTGASDGDTGILQLTAFVPPPINRRGLASRLLRVAETATGQTPGVVTFMPGSPVVSGDLANATEMTPVTLGFEFSFGALQGPTSRNFRFRQDISAPGNPDSFFFIEFAPADAAIDNAASFPTVPAVRKTSQQFAMTDGSMRPVTVIVTPLTGSLNQNLTFTATVESATDAVIAQSQSFTISVKNQGVNQ